MGGGQEREGPSTRVVTVTIYKERDSPDAPGSGFPTLIEAVGGGGGGTK